MKLFMVTLFIFPFSAFAGETFTPHCLGGCPQGVPDTNDLIVREIYTLSSNYDTRFSDWVAYIVSDETIANGCKQEWKADPELNKTKTLEPSDYEGAQARLDMELAQYAPLSSLCGSDEWHTTSYLSNITPQKSALHLGAWRKLESRIEELALLGDPVYVLTGPVYGKDQLKLPGADEPHKIPSGYWKVIIRNKPDYMVTAFMFSQDTPRKSDYCHSMYTLDVLERKTGLRLLPGIENYKADDSICTKYKPSPFECGC